MGGTYRGAPGVVSVAVDCGKVRDSRFCCGSWQKGHAGKVRVSDTGGFPLLLCLALTRRRHVAG